MSIISLDDLAKINSEMLGRGAPVQRDDTGYNKPDYSICQNIWYGMSYQQAAAIAEILQKYTNRQLTEIDTQDLKESADYYRNLAGYKPGITLQYKKDMTAFYFRYDLDIISVIKSANTRKWDLDQKCWYVSNPEVIKILDKLSQIADTENAKQYFLENYKPSIQEPVQETQQITKIILSATKNGNNYINIKCKYHAGVVTAIKSCIDRRYNPNNKSWDVSLDDISGLITRFEKFESEIDFSSLFQFLPKPEEKKEITLVEMPNETRKPFDHQLQAAKFLLEKKKAILADEMGGGKTTSAIIAAYNIPGKKLIVCPASLKLNWQKEIKLVDSAAKIGIINGKTITDLTGNDWYIINYDILSKHLENILSTDFTSVIFDECHYIKSINNSGKPTATRGKAALTICGKIPNVYMLTGTPITNKTKDIFNTLKAIEHPISNRWMPFAQRYCGAYQERYGWNMDGSSNRNELHEKLKPFMMRRLKSELLELPEKIRSFIPVEINVKEYDKLFADYIAEREHIEKGKQLVKLNALRHLLAIQKIPHTLEQIENLFYQEKQVVIFTCYQEVVNQIIEKFPHAGTITGNDSAEKRQQTVDNFQKGNIKIVVCNIIAAGVGLTLIASDTVIFNDFDWTPANHAQAEDRIHRIGQNKKCNIIYMFADNAEMDRKLSVILEKKLANINKIIDNNSDNMFNQLVDSL
jgi:SWI/SNF-related matrix-associated actin-dependent regulator 1 of chromatin subfamily A